MLLNNFLYTRSLIQNEQYHFRTSFSSLIPKTRINESSKNPLEDEKYKEEIKKIHIGGKNRKERILQREKDKLEEEKKELEAEKEELEEEKGELEEKNKGKDETISHNFNNREITLDNISKEGGKSYDKDIKNVVVSFF